MTKIKKSNLMTQSLISLPETSDYMESNGSLTLDRIDFSFTKAAKAKISGWLSKNMSLRRNRELVARKISVKSNSGPQFGKRVIQKTGDLETLSVSVDFSDEEDDLIVHMSDFSVYPKRTTL